MARLGFPPFVLDLDEERLWNGTKQVSLRRKPFAILRYLVANPRRLVTHDELLKHVWDGAVVSDSAVRTHVHELRQVLGEGVIETVIGRGYRFTPDVQAAASPASATPAEPPPDRMLVGRGPELEILRGALARAHAGRRQVCFVTGDPGIGKTTLVDAFVDELGGNVLAVRGSCIEQHGTPEAYVPVIELLGKLRRSSHGDLVLATLLRYAPTFLAQLPQLVPDDKLDEVQRRAGGGSEARLVRELLEALEALAAQETLVLVFEDLQWSDVATLDLLAMLGQRRERARLLVIATSRRAEAQTTAHPLNPVMRTLVARGGAIAVPLEHLDRDAIGGLVDRRFGDHDLPPALLDTVATITAGTPLFVVSLLDDLTGRGMLAERDGRWRLSCTIEEVAAHRPDSVKQLVDIQLDRLTLDEQRVLEAASLIGAEFSPVLVAAALEQPVEAVDETCDALVRRALFLRRASAETWPDGDVQTRYAVRHALVQEVCAARLVPARRQVWHRRIAARLESAYGDRAAEVALVLATHLDQGHLPVRAIEAYLVAAARNVARFAPADASHQWSRALELLRVTPEGRERDLRELQILGHLSQVAVRVRAQPAEPLGWFERMVELARRLDDPPRLAAALIDLAYRHAMLAGYHRADETLDELDALDRAAALPPALMVNARAARVATLICRGRLARAKELAEELLHAPIEANPDHPGVLGATDRSSVLLGNLAVIRWITGEPDAAVRDARAALDRDLAGKDPYAIGGSRVTLGRLGVLRGDPSGVREQGAEVLAFPGTEVWHAQAKILIAWAELHDGVHDPAQIETAVREVRERVAEFRVGATLVLLPAVELLRLAGRTAEAAALVDELLAFVGEHDERMLEAEYLRLAGELLDPTDRGGREAAFRAALASARTHGAHMLALRAALRLVEDGAAGARDELAAALGMISEGEETRDVIAARRLLAPA